MANQPAHSGYKHSGQDPIRSEKITNNNRDGTTYGSYTRPTTVEYLDVEILDAPQAASSYINEFYRC